MRNSKFEETDTNGPIGPLILFRSLFRCKVITGKRYRSYVGDIFFVQLLFFILMFFVNLFFPIRNAVLIVNYIIHIKKNSSTNKYDWQQLANHLAYQ